MTSPEDAAIIRKALEAERRRKERREAKPVIAVAPTAGVLPVLNLKSKENWRAFFHQAVAVIVPILVTANIVTENMATAWIPFVFAIVDGLLSVGNTTDKVRKIVYGGITALQAGGLVTVLLATVAPEYVPIGGAILAVASAFMARFYTPTTTMQPL